MSVSAATHERPGGKMPGFNLAGEVYIWCQVYLGVFLDGRDLIGRDMATVGRIRTRADP